MPGLASRRIPASYLLVLAGLSIRAVMQAGLTILVARLLRPDEYGTSVAIAGVAGFFSVWAGLGASALHLRDNATNPSQWRASYARHHARIVFGLLPLAALSLAVAWYVTSGTEAWIVLLLLVSGELLGAPAADLLVRSYQGRSMYGAMAAIMCALPLVRLLLLAALVAFLPTVELVHWATVVFVSGLAVAAFGQAMAVRLKGLHARARQASEKDSTSGIAFAVAAASSRIHADADKVVLARMSSMTVAGEYSLAYRLVDVLLLPVNSLIEWSTRAMFQHGRAGARDAVRALRTRWLIVSGLSVAASALILFLAPFLWILFGSKYEGIEAIARWLCLLPLTSAGWFAVRNIASTSGQERMAAAVEGAGALLNIVLCVILIGALEWRGAILATYITHLVMTSVALYVMTRTARCDGKPN